MVDRHPPHDVLVKMQPIIDPGSSSESGKKRPMASQSQIPRNDLPAAAEVDKMKAEVEKIDRNFPRVPPGAEMPRLSDDEFKQLVMATNSYEKERVFNLITSLQAQLKEHQSLIDRLNDTEVERKKLAERNAELERENAEQGKRIHEQDERLQALEGEVISLKIDLANEKGMVDHAQLSVVRLKSRNENLENENQGLKDRLSVCAEEGRDSIRTDFKYFMNINGNKSSTKQMRRSSTSKLKLGLDLSSSIKTAYTEASISSATSQLRPETLTESSEESDSVGESPDPESPVPEKNIIRLTRNWMAHRSSMSKENKFAYY